MNFSNSALTLCSFWNCFPESGLIAITLKSDIPNPAVAVSENITCRDSACNTSKTPKPSVDIETRQGSDTQTNCRANSSNRHLLTTCQAMFKRLSPASNTTERDIYICRFTCHEQIYISKLLFLFPYSLLYIIDNSSKLGLSFLFNPLFTLINNTINRRFYCGY